jgi:hypothetical protein
MALTLPFNSSLKLIRILELTAEQTFHIITQNKAKEAVAQL